MTALSAQMRAVEAEFPRWHLFASDTGDIWAVTTACPPERGGCGVTLEAPTPELMRHEIAVEEHAWTVAR